MKKLLLLTALTVFCVNVYAIEEELNYNPKTSWGEVLTLDPFNEAIRELAILKEMGNQLTVDQENKLSKYLDRLRRQDRIDFNQSVNMAARSRLYRQHQKVLGSKAIARVLYDTSYYINSPWMRQLIDSMASKD